MSYNHNPKAFKSCEVPRRNQASTISNSFIWYRLTMRLGHFGAYILGSNYLNASLLSTRQFDSVLSGTDYTDVSLHSRYSDLSWCKLFLIKTADLILVKTSICSLSNYIAAVQLP